MVVVVVVVMIDDEERMEDRESSPRATHRIPRSSPS